MATQARDISAKISDADIERARRQIGIPQYSPAAPYNLATSVDTIRHFLMCLVGDDNPLYYDPDHAARSRWRGLIAHPLYIISAGLREAQKYDAERKKLFKGLFTGVGKYYSGARYEFFRPIYEGDRIYSEYYTSEIEVKEQSSFAGGRSVIDTYRENYYDRAGLPFATHDKTFVNAERSGSKKTGRFETLERATYTPEDMAEIDAMYAAEARRGSDVRYWEDVEIGDSLGRIVKGPMTILDIVGHFVGRGIGDIYYPLGPLKINYKTRQRVPNFFTLDDWGVPQVQMRLHWDEKRAAELGLPGAYDFGVMRTAWIFHLATNWMGDDAWIWKLSSRLKGFNFIGDTHIISGEVVGKEIVDGRPVAHLALRGVSQRGDETVSAEATIILPSREHGPVVLPQPPADVLRRGADMQLSAAQATGRNWPGSR